MVDPARPAAARGGLVVQPFRATHFDPSRVNLGEVLCPPYDVVEPAEDDALRAQSPYNAVHVVRPRADADRPASTRYAKAGRLLREWQAAGVLRRDDEPALYIYEQDDGRYRQLGVLGAVQVQADADRVVLPHENVFPGPVADRLALMAQARAQLEPILLVAAEPTGLQALLERVASGPSWLDATPPDGSRHRLWRVSEADEINRIRSALGATQALIADGHHRYAAYQQLRTLDRQRADGVTPSDYGLALVVDPAGDGLTLSAIHRAVDGVDLASALNAARSAGRVTPLPKGDATTLLRAIAVASPDGIPAPSPVTAAVPPPGDQRPLDTVQRLDPTLDVERSPAAGPRDVSVVLTDGDSAAIVTVAPRATDRRSALAATVTADELLPALFGVTDGDRRVGYHHDPAAAIEVARHRRGVAVLLPPPRLEDVVALAGEGERMPRKSTSFGPKPRTGLLLRLLD